jgi:Na+-driven multidrug efflux pump
MGIEGAGIAGAFSTYVGLAIMITYTALPAYRGYGLFDLRRISRAITGDILKLSIPSAVATAAVITGIFLFAAIVARLDVIAPSGAVERACGGRQPVNSAATTDIVAILKLTFAACLAFGTSTATLVSQSLGERDPEKASSFGWASVRLGLLIFGAIGLCEGVLFTDPILRIVTHSELVKHAADMPLRIVGICTPLIAVGMILTQALFGAGNSRFVMIVDLVLLFAFLVPLAWILGITMNGGLVGIWLAAVAYVALLSLAMVWKFARGDWKAIRL